MHIEPDGGTAESGGQCVTMSTAAKNGRFICMASPIHSIFLLTSASICPRASWMETESPTST